MEYGGQKQPIVVVHRGVLTHQLQQRGIVTEQIHHVCPADFKPRQQQNQRADGRETRQPYQDDYFNQEVRGHDGAVPQRAAYGDVSVVRHGTEDQQVPRAVRVNQQSLKDTRGVGDQAALRHDAQNQLREESRSADHVANGQVEQQDEHGLVQFLAPGDCSEDQQVAKHNCHVQESSKQKCRVDIQIG